MRTITTANVPSFTVTSVNSLMRASLLMALMVLLALGSQAQTFVSRNVAGTSNTSLQLASTSSEKTQNLYTPDDLGTPSASGNVTRIYFMYNSTTAQTVNQLEIRLGQSNNTVLTTNMDNNRTDNSAVLVYGPTNTVIPAGTAGQWFGIDLDIPYSYDPTKALFVETFFTNVTGSTSWAVRIGANDASGTNRKATSGTAPYTSGSLAQTRANFGFDVYSTAANEAGITAILTPTSPSPTGSHNVDVTLKNFGTAALTSVNIDWSVNGVSQTQVNWSGSIASNGTATASLGSFNFSQLGYYLIIAQTSLPNGAADANSANDAFFTTVKICNALSGAYTINGAVGTGGTNFQTFAHAADFLNTCGVSGPVTFAVSNGPFNESGPVVFNAITGSSSTNTITINGNNQDVNWPATTTTDRDVFTLNGTSYMTIDDLNINATGTVHGWGVHLWNGAHHNTISDNDITISSTSTTSSNSAGIVLNGSATTYDTGSDDNDNNTITGNSITGGYSGIVISGDDVSVAQPLTGNVISNNTIRDFYAQGIFLEENNGIDIFGNNISRTSITTFPTTLYGIYTALLGDNANMKIYNNRIHSLLDAAAGATTSTTMYGINLSSNDFAVAAGSENYVYNNQIYNLKSDGVIYGIYESDNSYIGIYYNTIAVEHTTSAATSTTGIRGFYHTTANSGVEFMNNVIYINRSGTGAKTGIYINTTTAPLPAVDYNVIYMASGNIGSWGTSGQATLGNWQSATTNTMDMNSVNVDPAFVDISTFDFTPTASSAGNFATPLTAVTTDFSGNSRNATNPDPGAIEWVAAGLDASLTWVSPSGATAAGNTDIVVNISNTSTTTINTIDITYTDGVTPVSQTFSPNLLSGGNTNLTFTTQFNVGTYHTLQAWINEVNSITDNVQSNDTTAEVTVCAALSGAYTINDGAAASATNFQSFQAAADRLATCGVAGPVTLTVAPGSGPYTEQVTFSTIPGVSAVNTVTLEGSGETITAITNTTNRHIIRLSDVSRFTINNLNIEVDATSTGGGTGVHIFNTGSYITVSNCDIDLNGQTSTLFGGVVASASFTSFLTSGIYSNITVTGNTITAGGYGVDIYGAAANKATGCVISNNTIYDFSSNGIYLFANDGTVVSGNTLNKRAGSNSTVNGIQVAQSDNQNVLVFNNFLSHEQTTGSFRGIYLAGGTGHKAYNNVIFDVRATSNSWGIVARAASSAPEIFYNTVVLDYGTPATGEVFGFDEELSNSGAILRNNIFYITRTSAVAEDQVGLNFAGSSSMNSNNNLIYVPGGSVAARSGVLYTTLADWQGSVYAADANSYSTEPYFEAGVKRPTNGAVNNKGVTYGGVTTDIIGTTRGATPDMGAYEFTPAANDASIATFVEPGSGSGCGATLNVVFELLNAGSATLTSATINWTVNGVPQTAYNWTGSLASGLSTNVTLGNIAIADNTLYDFAATSSLPNGAADPNAVNDSYTRLDWRKGFNGAYTINGAAAVSGTNYQTFQSIFDDLAIVGVCGPVTIAVSNGPYTEQVIATSVPGTSSTNTITLNGNTEVLQFDAPSSPSIYADMATLVLDGISYLTVDNLTITGLDGSNAAGVNIVHGASHITISDCAINIPLTLSGNSNGGGILVSEDYLAESLPASDDLNFIGNTITGGSIYVTGDFTSPPPTDHHTNVNIIDNVITNGITEYIYTHAVQNLVVRGNDVSSPTETPAGTVTAINMYAGTYNFLLEENRIHDIIGTSGVYCIDLAGGFYPASGVVRNNAVYNITNTGFTYGIQEGGGSSPSTGAVSIYHNTIVLDAAGGTGSKTAYQWDALTTAITRNVRNNIFVINSSSSGTKVLIDVSNANNSGVFTSNNNVLWFGPLTAGTQRFGEMGGTTYTTFSGWQAAGRDVNSVNADPVFANLATGDLTPTTSDVDDVGVNVGVTTDILGNPRSTLKPDAGAYEFCIPGTWTGATDNDWFTASNWCDLTVPTLTTDVLIPNVTSGSGNFPVIEGLTPAEAQNVTIRPNANLTFAVIAGNIPTLNVYGNFTNNGADNLGNGNLTFTGTSQVLTGPTEVSGIVRIAAGAHLVTNGNLTLNSGGQLLHGAGTPTYTGTISADPIKVRRQGFAGGVLWNFWGVPVTGASSSILGQRVHYYDPLSATDPNTVGGLQNGWKPMTGVMNIGTGYISQGGNLVTFTGTVDNLNTNPTITAPINAGAGVNGVPYNLLGNPFPSAMDAEKFMEVNGPAVPFGGNNTVAGTMWFWDDDGTGGTGYEKSDFAMWSGAGSAGPNDPSKTPNGHIATAQGFQVEKLTPGAGTVEFNNGMRSTTNNIYFRRKPIERLWISVTNTHDLYNEVLIAFADDATDGYDAGYDAKKMRGNPHIALYTKLGGKDYMIQAYSPLTTEKVVELGLDAGLTGTYTLNLKKMENMDETVVPMLEDRLTGVWQNLRMNPNYTFNVTAKGSIVERFYVHFNKPLQITTVGESCTDVDGQMTFTQTGNMYWNFMVLDPVGNVVKIQDAFTGSITLNDLAQGDYTVLLTDRYGYQLTKQITVEGAQKVVANFAPTATSVEVDEAVSFTNNSSGATSYEWDFGDGNTLSGVQNPTHTYAAAGTYTVMLRASNDECYNNRYSTIVVNKQDDGSVATGIGNVKDGLLVYSYGKKIFAKLNLNETDARIFVYDVLGKEIHSNEISTKGSYEVDLSGYPDYAYFVVIRTSSDTHRVKVNLSGN